MLRLLDNRWIARAGNLSFLAGLVVLLVRLAGGLPLTALVAGLLAMGVVLMALPYLARAAPRATKPAPTPPAAPPKASSTPPATPASPPPDPASDSPGYSSAVLKATGTNDGQFPRIESAMDSLGHTAERSSVRGQGLNAFTDRVLRPGQQVTFELAATDPNGDDLELSVITPARSNASVTISDGIVTWNVREEDIADPANVHIYVASQRSYHRSYGRWDDVATFAYRVLSRV